MRAYPLLLGCDAANAGAVVACLADAGLTRAELERVLLGWPKVLLMECVPALRKLAPERGIRCVHVRGWHSLHGRNSSFRRSANLSCLCGRDQHDNWGACPV